MDVVNFFLTTPFISNCLSFIFFSKSNFLTLIKFIEKHNNIFDTKQTYHQNIFNETSLVSQMLLYFVKLDDKFDLEKKWNEE